MILSLTELSEAMKKQFSFIKEPLYLNQCITSHQRTLEYLREEWSENHKTEVDEVINELEKMKLL